MWFSKEWASRIWWKLWNWTCTDEQRRFASRGFSERQREEVYNWRLCVTAVEKRVIRPVVVLCIMVALSKANVIIVGSRAPGEVLHCTAGTRVH